MLMLYTFREPLVIKHVPCNVSFTFYTTNFQHKKKETEETSTEAEVGRGN